MTKSLFIPLGVFVLLVILLTLGFGLKDPHFLPSELIDKPFPEFTLADLHEDRMITHQALKGRISLVNVWATWCPSCLLEHPVLTRIAADEDIPLIGINYNDDTVKARGWLTRHGNPYQFHIVDDTGQLAIKLGVYGAPETYIVDAAGVIRYRHVGAVNAQVWEDTLAPAIQLIEEEGAG